MSPATTILAISSAVGPAARMIVRLSGPDALTLARRVCSDAGLAGGTATRTTLRLPNLSVPIWLHAFVGPRSYSGEDLVELHLPGNPLLAQLALQHLTHLGAQPAEPGEFTARAYFNGRMDLTQAEGVAAAIAAQNEQELRAARQLLAGELAHRLRPAIDEVAQTLALLEVGIDFSEEDVTILSAEQLAGRIARADAMLAGILGDSSRFERLSHEPRIVLAGRPNAGKSTLLNALAGHDRAVVSPVAGTTRDVIWADVPLARGMVRVIDVAGLEEGGEGRRAGGQEGRREEPDGCGVGYSVRARSSGDMSGLHSQSAGPGAVTTDAAKIIADQMRQHALRELEGADLLVLVHDPATPLPQLPRKPDLIVQSKSDLRSDASASVPTEEHTPPPSHSSLLPSCPPPLLPSFPPSLPLSARTGQNLPALRELLDRMAFGSAPLGASLALNARHVVAIEEARDALARARDAADAGSEVIALELRESLDALGRVLGAITPDDLLGARVRGVLHREMINVVEQRAATTYIEPSQGWITRRQWRICLASGTLASPKENP